MNFYKTDTDNGIEDKQKLIMKLDAISDYFNNQITLSGNNSGYTEHDNLMDKFIKDIDLIKSELLKER